MAYFDDDDEEEVLPECVTNYKFVNESEEPVCFSILPFQWEDSNSPQESKTQVFLLGDGDDGLQKIYKQVIAWKMELQGFCPVVCVLSKESKWIKLLKAKKSFEVVIRKVMISLQCLHFIKKDPKASEKTLWDSVRKTFSHYEIRPSRLDLQDHVALIREISQKDEDLGKSQLLLDLIDARKKVMARNEDIVDTTKSEFINDNEDEEADEGDQNSSADEEDEEDDGYDSMCCICDNGGNILCCDGRCMRTFHAVKGDGRDSDCATLGLSRKEVEEAQIFKCPNCRFEKHQCFVCGKLGSSAESSREVFPCVNATCGHFYHPKCVAPLLHLHNKTAAMEEEKKISAGHAFACPYHKCLVCRGIENKEVHELQFAMCRRCPRSYHRKCLPSEISFDDENEDIIQRAWDGLLLNRILIYCLDHEMDEELGTPARNHLAFPEDPQKKKMLPPPSKKINLVREKGTVGSKEKELKVSADNGAPRKGLPVSDRNRIVKASAASRKQLVSSNGLGSVAKDEYNNVAIVKAKSSVESVRPLKKAVTDAVAARAIDSIQSLSTLPRKIDPDTVKRIETLVQRSSASLLTLDDFIDKKEKISTHIFSGRHVDKNITLGKVKGSIEAVQTALKQVEEDGGKTDNAKAVCEPKVLHQIMTWKNKLSVYLGPFVHGLLYTSFGRHFTKPEKLEEIVDRLHWYVESRDMIVDFCCGSNDFSLILKKKLEDTNKICSFRNIDIIPPKNDFAFLKKDWMKVRHKDLNNIPGSQLIIGLNPPFGMKAALANKFIDKALEFRPKLLILIVPKETQRLDQKNSVSYDLIWEDDKKLAGRAFYLPGSVDDNDKQVEDWNVDPPPLYLWSRSDLAGKHREIARERGHLPGYTNSSDVGKGNNSDVAKSMGIARQLSEKDDGSVRKDRHMNKDVGKGMGATRQKDDGSVRKDGNDRETAHKTASCSPTDRDNEVIPKPNVQVFNKLSRNKKKKKRKAERQDVSSSAKPETRDASLAKKKKRPADPSSNAREDLSDMSISPPASPGNRNVNETTHQTMSRDETIPVVPRMTPDYPMPPRRLDNTDNLKDSREKSPYMAPRDVPLSASFAQFTDPAYTRSADLVSRYTRDGGLDVYSQDARGSLYGQQPYSDYLQARGSLGLGREDTQPTVSIYGQQDSRNLQGSRYSLGGTSVLGQTSSLSMIDKYSATIDKYTPRLNEGNKAGYQSATTAEQRQGLYGTTPSGCQVPDVRGYSVGPRYSLNDNSSAGWLND